MDTPTQSQHVKEAINEFQNDLLSRLDVLFSKRLRIFKSQINGAEKALSDTQYSKIQDLLCQDAYKFHEKGCDEQHKFNQSVISKLKTAEQNFT